MNEKLQAILAQIQNQQAVLVDVREPDEWEEGVIEGAELLSLTDIREGKVNKHWPADQPIYLYCRRGQRSLIAQELLAEEYPLAESLPYGFDTLCFAGWPAVDHTTK